MDRHTTPANDQTTKENASPNSSGEATPLDRAACFSDESQVVADAVPEYDRSKDFNSKTDRSLQVYIDLLTEELCGDGVDMESHTRVKEIVCSMHNRMRKQIEEQIGKQGEKGKTENVAEACKKLQALSDSCVPADNSSQGSDPLPWDAHIRATWKCLRKLASDCFPKELLDAVFSRHWVREDEKDSIVGKATPRKQTEEMFRVVMMRLNADVFRNEFLEVLRERSPHLADLLETAIAEEQRAGPSKRCLVCLFKDYVPVKSLAPALQRDHPVPFYLDLQKEALSNSIKSQLLIDNVKFDDVMNALKETYRPLYDQFQQKGVRSMTCYCQPGSDSGGSDSVGNVSELASNPDLDQVERAYCMSSEPRGRCLIIRNSQNFELDEKNITSFFKHRKFNVCCKHNLTAKEMENVLVGEANHDHSGYDAFVCFVLSDAREGGILGEDGSCVSLEDMAKKLRACRCPSLAGKPKLFLHQGSRGSKEQDVVVDEEDEGKALSDCSDFFLAYSTPAGYISHGRSGGSVFVSTLLEVLKKHEQEDLLSCMARVSGLLDGARSEKESAERRRQVPEFCSRLRKPLFLSQHPTVTERPGNYRPRDPPEEEEAVEIRKKTLDATNRRLSDNMSDAIDSLLTRSSGHAGRRPLSTKF